MDHNDQSAGLTPLTAQVRGEYLAEIKSLARESYVLREIGGEEDFEMLWRQAFFVEESDS